MTFFCQHGIATVPEKVAGIQQFPQPTWLQQLRRYLCLINYYRKFIPGCAKTMTLFATGIKKIRMQKVILVGETLTIFPDSKMALVKIAKLSYICEDDNLTLTLTTSASSNLIGSVLHQM